MTKIISRIIELTPPKGKRYRKLFLHYNEKKGWFIEFWKGDRHYICTNNMVFLAPFHFAEIHNKLPKKEYAHGSEEKMIERAGEFTEKDFLAMEKKCDSVMKQLGWINMEVIPYELMLDLFDGIDIGIIPTQHATARKSKKKRV